MKISVISGHGWKSPGRYSVSSSRAARRGLPVRPAEYLVRVGAMRLLPRGCEMVARVGVGGEIKETVVYGEEKCGSFHVEEGGGENQPDERRWKNIGLNGPSFQPD